MTKREAYLKCAEKYCESNELEFVCNDLTRLFRKPLDWLDDYDILVKRFPEICLFSVDEIIKPGIAWMTHSHIGNMESTRIKALIMLFCIEMLKDEKKVQKKSKVRNIR